MKRHHMVRLARWELIFRSFPHASNGPEADLFKLPSFPFENNYRKTRREMNMRKWVCVKNSTGFRSMKPSPFIRVDSVITQNPSFSLSGFEPLASVNRQIHCHTSAVQPFAIHHFGASIHLRVKSVSTSNGEHPSGKNTNTTNYKVYNNFQFEKFYLNFGLSALEN